MTEVDQLRYLNDSAVLHSTSFKFSQWVVASRYLLSLIPARDNKSVISWTDIRQLSTESSPQTYQGLRLAFRGLLHLWNIELAGQVHLCRVESTAFSSRARDTQSRYNKCIYLKLRSLELSSHQDILKLQASSLMWY
jgi:hypothetical protein